MKEAFMMKAFQKLGDQIAAEWKSVDESNEHFPEIATSALRKSGVLESVEPEAIIEWLGSSSDLPEQYLKDFGQPPINVYVGDKFHIQALFWIDSTTAIHEHSFSGAFGVLAGSSVHSRYSFEPDGPLSNEVQIGSINFISSELLKRGDIHMIETGEKFIHSLFHLDRPSISVVVRTHSQSSRQFSYLKPNLAYDAYYQDKRLTSRLKMLDSLQSFDTIMFWKYAQLLLNQDPWMLLQILNIVYQRAAEFPDQWKQLLEAASQHYGRHVIDSMELAVKEEARVRKLNRLRSVIHDADLRFFLALLLNVPKRETLLALVAERFGTADPESLVVDWVRQMSDRGLFRSKTNPLLLDIIRLAMRCNSFEEATSVWQGQNGAQQVEPEKMKEMWEVAHASEFLRPLFL
jgi:hypothetical protein